MQSTGQVRRKVNKKERKKGAKKKDRVKMSIWSETNRFRREVQKIRYGQEEIVINKNKCENEMHVVSIIN
jgi:hypothetical protein